VRPTLLVLASTYPRWPNDPEPGFVHELCRRLTKQFDVIALVPDSPDAQPSGILDGVEVIRYRYAPRSMQTLVNNGGIATNLKRSAWKWLLVPVFVAGQYLAARRVVKKRHVDVVHAHWLIPQGVIAKMLLRSHRIPYLVTSHGGDLFGFRGPALNRLKQMVAASSSGMTVVSSAMQHESLRLGLSPPQFGVVPMGVDLQERFVPDTDCERIEDTLLFVGRLVPKKGLRHLLDAMPAVLSRRPNVILTIAGFGPEKEALKRQAHALGIEASIRFSGAVTQPELPAIYRRASLFVAPFIRDDSGNQEGLPVVLMEAIGCGCPAVVGNVAGIHDLLGDHADAISIDPRDSVALSDAILNALDHPHEARQRADTMRQAVASRVDWQVIAAAYAVQLQACLPKNSGDRT
jgi:glycosyltransferase involved in cell wall biosynthesis